MPLALVALSLGPGCYLLGTSEDPQGGAEAGAGGAGPSQAGSSQAGSSQAGAGGGAGVGGGGAGGAGAAGSGTSGQSGAGGGGGAGASGASGAGGAGGSGAAGSGTSGQAGAGGGGPGLTEVFVAQGYVGRTVVSCDQGQSWVADRSDDDALRCFSGVDCDHHPGSPRGITFGAGHFVATFGWGAPGADKRSEGGVDWEVTLPDKEFAGVVFGKETFLLGARPPQRSSDGGVTWGVAGEPDSAQWNIRRTGFADHDGGRFVLAFQSGASDLNISKDQGNTWVRPSSLPEGCARDMQWSGGIEYGKGVMLVLGGDGTACRSLDGGDTWTAASLGGTVSGRLLWDGSAFVTWGSTDSGPSRFQSADGAAWTATPLQVQRPQPDGSMKTSAGPVIGAVARGASGALVAVNGEWDRWYEKQEFYRSTDGVTWQALPAGAYKGGHPIGFIATGLVPAALACP